jgi:hypothetical protein
VSRTHRQVALVDISRSAVLIDIAIAATPGGDMDGEHSVLTLAANGVLVDILGERKPVDVSATSRGEATGARV